MRRTVLDIALLVTLFSLTPSCQRNETENAKDASGPAPKATLAPIAAVAAIPPEHLDRIVELFNKGIGLMERYEPLEAVKAFEEVVRLAPGWTTGRLNYGIALLNAQTDEGYARAEVELKEVIADAPDNPYAHYALGMLLRHLTRLSEAKAQFEKVLQIDPEDADAHYQLGILLDDDPAAARDSLLEAIRDALTRSFRSGFFGLKVVRRSYSAMALPRSPFCA